MTNDSNRGRDLPRGPKHARLEVAFDGKSEADPKLTANAEKVAQAKKIARVKNELLKITNQRGYDNLIEVGNGGMPEKLKEKQRKVVLSALGLGIPVHPKLLREYGLTVQSNPKAPDEDDDGKAPF